VEVTCFSRSIYEDIRELPEIKLRMPFRAITNSATLTIKNYEFNAAFEEDIMKKPK
jgi:hypothetical protein